MTTTTDEWQGLVEDLEASRIDRATFLRRAVAAGLSASAASGLLAAHAAKAAPTATTRTLRIGPWNSNYSSLDPATNIWDNDTSPISDIFEGLAMYKPGSNWKVTNVLAESIELSRDAKRVGFTLKRGIEFHGGYGEMTADDVKYSIERAAGLRNLYPDATQDDKSYYASDWPGLAGVKKTGKYSGTIVLKEPFVPLMTLTIPYATSAYIVSRKAVEKLGRANWATNPIGTGPYESVSFTPAQNQVLRRFKKYGGAQKHIFPSYHWDEIQITIVPRSVSGAALTAPLQAGASDFISVDGLTAGQFRGNRRYKLYEPSSPLNYTFIFINVNHPKLKDIRVRQAIRWAIDVPGVIQVLNNNPNTRINSLIAAPLPGAWKNAPARRRNVAKAKALLAAAGAKNLELDLADGLSKDVGEYIQSNLADVGIKLNVITSPPDAYQHDVNTAQLYIDTYGGAPDPYYQFEWFTCSQVGIWNWAFWCDQNYSRLENLLGTTTSQKKRVQMAIQMQKLMDQACAFIWINTPTVYAISQPHIKAVFSPAGWPLFRGFKAVA